VELLSEKKEEILISDRHVAPLAQSQNIEGSQEPQLGGGRGNYPGEKPTAWD